MLRDSSRLQPCSNFLISKPEIACSRDKKVAFCEKRWLVSYRASPEGWAAYQGDAS
jgi:hypothetical protein